MYTSVLYITQKKSRPADLGDFPSFASSLRSMLLETSKSPCFFDPCHLAWQVKMFDGQDDTKNPNEPIKEREKRGFFIRSLRAHHSSSWCVLTHELIHRRDKPVGVPWISVSLNMFDFCQPLPPCVAGEDVRRLRSHNES